MLLNSQTLGDYQLIKQIGKGPLGAVYLAEHTFMKKQYCIKVLPEELTQDRAFVQRFEEEIEKLAKLDHPHIVKVHNISYANGVYFIVSDCIVDELGETTNLSQYVLGLDKRLSEEAIFAILSQIASALDYAHNAQISGTKGFIHRELKLNNILVAVIDKIVNVYLSDFGVGKIIGEGAILTRSFQSVAEALGIADRFRTSSGGEGSYPVPALEMEKLSPLHTSFLQTFAFLAPEQKSLAKGTVITQKTDVYAFGIVAYYLLTGTFPEGAFPMPSEVFPESKYNWDRLVRACLHPIAEKRPGKLLAILEGVQVKQVHMPQVKIVKDPDETNKVMSGPVQEVYRTRDEEGRVYKPVIQTRRLERPEIDHDPGAIFQMDHTVKHYIPEKKEEKVIEPLLTEMVIIPGRRFLRGANDGHRDEMPQHEVNVDGFALDVHAVTNEQFVRFLEFLGGVKDNNHNDVIRLKDSRIKKMASKWSIESGYAKHPVVGVTWYGAVSYAKWVGKRLPTEAEWELAAQGEEVNPEYPTGEEIEKSQANFFSSDTTAVKSYPPNKYGLYDMAGNVYEWCQDWYSYNYYDISAQEPDNPKGPLQGVYRVLRGGCWKSLKEDLRCSKRHRNNPGTVNSTYGFRCAADIVEER
jgi:formylglycine-generating enzyme required for sulfatase activity